MNPKIRKSLIGSAIALLVASPVWAAEDPAVLPDTIPRTDAAPAGDASRPAEIAPSEGTPSESAPARAAPGDMASPDPSLTTNPLYSQTPEDLRGLKVVDVAGKKVGITSAGSGSDICARWTIAHHKLEFTRVPLGGGGLVPNLLTGNIRSRKIAILIGNGVDAAAVSAAQAALKGEGAACKLVAPSAAPN